MRTWKEVAEIYSKENPDDKLSAGVAARIGHVAIEKIKKTMEDDEQLHDDLLEFAIKDILR
tara:strand:- start:65 stop:247 length:183 start_codon:yes stop_codon:yes gene_type:complete